MTRVLAVLLALVATTARADLIHVFEGVTASTTFTVLDDGSSIGTFTSSDVGYGDITGGADASTFVWQVGGTPPANDPPSMAAPATV